MSLMVSKKQGRAIYITAYPYATQGGSLIVPNELSDKAAIEEYIKEHFDEIEFGEPDLDYVGTEFDIWEK